MQSRSEQHSFGYQECAPAADTELATKAAANAKTRGLFMVGFLLIAPWMVRTAHVDADGWMPNSVEIDNFDAETDTPMPQVAILIYDDCQPSAVSTVIEALSIGNFQWSMANNEGPPPFSWRTISFDGRPVHGMGDIRLAADGPIEALGRPDLIFVPAVRSDDQARMMNTIKKLAVQWGGIIGDHHRRNGYLAANCSATFLLAEAGLLNGRKATTSWFLARTFRDRYPSVHLVPETLVTRDARIFSSAAFSACFNLGLEIIAEFLGPRSVIPCARVMLIDVNRTTQLSFSNLQQHAQHGDELVLRAQTFLLSNVSRAPSLERLAQRLHVTTRTLGRRFKKATGETPITFLQNARVERAKRLLETTNISFDSIACRVGYEDTSSFRRLFARASGISPREYRERFGIRKKLRGDASNAR